MPPKVKLELGLLLRATAVLVRPPPMARLAQRVLTRPPKAKLGLELLLRVSAVLVRPPPMAKLAQRVLTMPPTAKLELGLLPRARQAPRERRRLPKEKWARELAETPALLQALPLQRLVAQGGVLVQR